MTQLTHLSRDLASSSSRKLDQLAELMQSCSWLSMDIRQLSSSRTLASTIQWQSWDSHARLGTRDLSSFTWLGTRALQEESRSYLTEITSSGRTRSTTSSKILHSQLDLLSEVRQMQHQMLLSKVEEDKLQDQQQHQLTELHAEQLQQKRHCSRDWARCWPRKILTWFRLVLEFQLWRMEWRRSLVRTLDTRCSSTFQVLTRPQRWLVMMLSSS